MHSGRALYNRATPCGCSMSEPLRASALVGALPRSQSRQSLYFRATLVVFNIAYSSCVVFQWVFLPDPSGRHKLTLPPKAQVDYRAACFCHRTLIDIGYVCSVCLSSKYFFLILFLEIHDDLCYT